MSPPALADHFVPASLPGLLRRGHPYDFIETYQTMQALYGYRTWYVNLGLWTDGPGTEEPGRKLALRVAAPLGLQPGEHLIDVGSGLGQGAVDLLRHHQLGRVTGLNPNQRQLAFATALAASEGLADRITHLPADACTHLQTLPAASAHGLTAIECVGHFADPDGFLAGARHVLRPGRRLAFCLNLAAGGLPATERALIRASFGFVPATAEVWQQRLLRAGFSDLRLVDLTGQVTGALAPILDARLAHPDAILSALPRSTRWLTHLLHTATSRAVRAGRVRYALFDAAA
jgi:SAM-dependent methyltransferase